MHNESGTSLCCLELWFPTPFSKLHFLCIWPPSHLTVAHLNLLPKAELFLLQLLPLLKGWLEWSLDATGESFFKQKDVCRLTKTKLPSDSASLHEFYYSPIFFKRKHSTLHRSSPATLTVQGWVPHAMFDRDCSDIRISEAIISLCFSDSWELARYVFLSKTSSVGITWYN